VINDEHKSKGNAATVEILVEKGANTSLKDKFGVGPFDDDDGAYSELKKKSKKK